MKRGFGLFTVIGLLSLLIGISAPASILHQVASVEASAETGYPVYLPIIRNDYNWLAYREWTPWGLQEQEVIEIYTGAKPGWLWLLTSGEISHSTDYGVTWQQVDFDYWYPNILAVNNPNTLGLPIFAAAYRSILISEDGLNWSLDAELGYSCVFLGWSGSNLYTAFLTDGGYQVYHRNLSEQWEAIGGLLPERVVDLAVFQSKLYAATNVGLFRLEGSVWIQVSVYGYPSIDRSVTASWFSEFDQQPSLPFASDMVQSFPVNTLLIHNDAMYAGTSSPRGVYKTSDGNNWTALDVGMTGPYSLHVEKLIASKSGILFAATWNDGVFMSTNGGERWQALDSGLPHTITGYDVLLDGIHATSLALIRDEGGQQTLAAAFHEKGLWVSTVDEATWMPDLNTQNPPKAVLVIGPVDPPNHYATKSNIYMADRLAAIMESNGMQVVKVYWPNSTWENVRAAISGASIVIYKGHGTAVSEPSPDPTELYGSVNSFCLVHPLDPAGARLGTQDMLVTTNRLAENAIGIFSCCFCAGSSASDTEPVPEDWARRRIESYASTIIRIGGGAYFSGIYEEAFLKAFFANLDKPLGEIFKDIQGTPQHTYPHILWPDLSVWFDGSSSTGYSQAFSGDPNLTPRQVLGR